ncbi:hypothetical protein [Ornithinibacillus halophilus]|uniref:Uncharacterized protein n=1 Tax=Ornithinibacillus halophilus TaxID=930117 RepID=A0A1M5I2X7_9BACI|nr:hypothetical protein [Ornithinibacillus halophilus]SHG22409.1 hypothetical protein SAMN05216225_102117 [Ornithinibacillus halophilus]
MKMNVSELIIRKLMVTFVTTLVVSLILSVIYVGIPEHPYNLGNQFIGWSFFYCMYVGAIILIYGNFVSVILEFAMNKWFPGRNSIYVLLHGLFGSANIILFMGMWSLLISGVFAAILYALIDRWIHYRFNQQKGVKVLIASPVIIYVLMWGTLQILSPSLPPFTEEDAVEFATSGEGTVIDNFPEEIDTWSGQSGDYQVVRETSVEEWKKEEYIVTFTESWKNNNENGSWYLSYIVKRGSSTLYDQGGEAPLYQK